MPLLEGLLHRFQPKPASRRSSARNLYGLFASRFALLITPILAVDLALTHAQENAPGHQSLQSLDLPSAVEIALKNYPQVHAALARASAAGSGIELAKTAYLPRTELLWQATRATRNNVFGLFFPAAIPLPISGPVLGTNSGTNVWGTSAGFLFSWEPFDFGSRQAKVEVARAQETQAVAGVSATRLDIASAAADAFLTLLASQQSARAAQASVDRAQVLLKSVEALVQNELRPGADLARARAELAAAQNQLIQAEQAEQVNRARLAQWLGLAGTPIRVQAGVLPDKEPANPSQVDLLKSHPLAIAQLAAVDVVKARQRELDRTYFPHFDFQAATYGRGTGALTDGRVLGGWNGLAPDTFNWAVGFTARFQLFDFATLRRKKAIEQQNQGFESARFNQVIQELTTQAAKAKADWDAARRIAANTPVQLEAARSTEQQVRARYQAGLATLLEVADAQRLLTQAETEDSIARLRVWRALLGIAAAQGDLEPFLSEVRRQAP